jgi:hypothetical protein
MIIYGYGIVTDRDLRILPAETLRVKYIRMHGMVRDRLTRFKQSLEKKASLLYIVDLRENKRDIYKFDILCHDFKAYQAWVSL